MAETVQQRWQYAQSLEQALHKKLKDKEPLYEEIEHLITQIRIACEACIFLDFDFSTAEKVESRLWEAHTLVNNRYRKIIAKYKSEEFKTHVVEKRKWEKRYADFLKTSQHFYKGYIQRLASHFDGLAELRKIAHKLQLSTLSADDRVRVSDETQRRISLSCHDTLLRLGDLSRYRNTFKSKEKSWDIAMSYYELANEVNPYSGHAFNQMAVIALAEEQHLDAIYYLYRALAIQEPHPMAERNLETEFRSVGKKLNGGGRRSGRPSAAPENRSKTTTSSADPLIRWFVLLHSNLYRGEEFSNHDEMENEVLGQMTLLLKEQSLEGVLDKIVLINISAQYFAEERLRISLEKAKVSQALLQTYSSFLRLNIRTLFMLLQLLEPELADSSDDDAPDVTGRVNKKNIERVTAVTRRILPSLRQYSVWLVSRAEYITAQKGNSLISVYTGELWSMYCSTLSLLVGAFPLGNLSAVDYLLEEDAATVGMKPLRDGTLGTIYTNGQGELKPRISDPGVDRSHPNVEMIARVRDLLWHGVLLATEKTGSGEKRAPLQLVDGKFHFVEDGLPMSSDRQQPLHNLTPPQQSTAAPLPNSPYPVYGLSKAIQRPPSVAQSDAQSMSTDMYRMVDDLVTPTAGQPSMDPGSFDTTPYGMQSFAGAGVSALSEAHAGPPSRHEASPSPFRVIPGIYSSPFSPQPGELGTVTPARPRTAGHVSSMLPPGLPQPTYTPTPQGGARNGNSMWTHESPSSVSAATPTRLQNFSQAQQHPATTEYTSTSMSAFSHPSSLYVGTPRQDFAPERGRGDVSHNASTTYGGASELERMAMLQSSMWQGSQLGWPGPNQTPPNGQR